MLGVQYSMKAKAYRRKAAMCDSYATSARSDADREQLVRMRESWLALASNEDWLDGHPPAPPDNTLALSIPA
jgi:hypothetical protein